MAKIVYDLFKGIMPKLADDKLPPEMGQVASDIKTASGALRPYRRSTADVLLPGTAYQTIFEYLEGGNNHWVYYNRIAHWVRSPVADDEFERMYVTGANDLERYQAFVNDKISGAFDFTTDFYYPGAPSGASVTMTYTAGGSDYRAYFYTYVSRYGEEGPPSELMETVDAVGAGDWDGTSNPVLGPFPEPATEDEHLKGAAVGGNSAALRIYRTSTAGDGSAAFLLVDEITIDATGPASTAWATYTYTDTKVDTQLDGLCESIFYDRAPDGLSNLRGHPNGFFVAFKNNVLHFSEPEKPWAWPEDYRIPIDHTIIGMGIHDSTIVVATDGFIYTFSGPHPTSLYKKKMTFAPCLSQRATVETHDGVMFPSLEGFQMVSSAGATNVTQDIFKPEDWLNYELETMHGSFYNKAYYGFYKTADYEGHIIIDFLNGAITTGFGYHQASHVALLDGKFRTVYNSDVSDPSEFYISQWDADPTEYRPYTFKSKKVILEKPVNFKVAQIILDSDFIGLITEYIEDQGKLAALNATAWAGDLRSTMNGSMLNEQDVNGDTLFSLRQLGIWSYVDFTVFVDGVPRFVKQVTNSNMFKLPRGFRDKKWEVQVEGMIPVKRIIMATSTEEIV
jgi:hypothetical protein